MNEHSQRAVAHALLDKLIAARVHNRKQILARLVPTIRTDEIRKRLKEAIEAAVDDPEWNE